MNQTKLIRLLGNTIKQGDSSSVFRYKLETILKDKLNGPCKVELINSSKEIYQFFADVNNNVAEFTIQDVLPTGVYVVEIEHGGYVFPSVNNQIITITENVGVELPFESVFVGGLPEAPEEVEVLEEN